MSERNTTPQAPDHGQDHGRKGSLVSPAAIIVGALAAATTALLRPIVEASTESAVLVAVLLSVATTISKPVYTALVDKFKHGYQDRRWRPLLFAGLLAGLAACLLGISVVSGVELAAGKEPSIAPNGTPIMPYIVGSERGPQPPQAPPPDGWGAGLPMQYKQGSQPQGWVERGGDNCPDVPNPDQKTPTVTHWVIYVTHNPIGQIATLHKGPYRQVLWRIIAGQHRGGRAAYSRSSTSRLTEARKDWYATSS
jgi:hypothetical protein